MTKMNIEKIYRKRRRLAFRDACGSVRGSLDAMLVTKCEDVSYLSGFTGEDAFLVIGRVGGKKVKRAGGREFAVLLTDGRYDEQAKTECAGVEVFVRTEAMAVALSNAIAGKSVRKIGFQEDHCTVKMRSSLSARLGAKKFVPVADVIGNLRQVKDELEIRAIRKSIRIAERAFVELCSGGKRAFIGKSEREIAARLDYLMRLAGADKPSFETIVAAGANASQPHYRPSGWKIRSSQPVLIDWGAMSKGYCSDLTRVVFPSTIPSGIEPMYETVLQAQKSGIKAIKAGRSVKTVDLAARCVIEQSPWAGKFVHGLGHGIGREVHENPGLSQHSRTTLRAGMIVTVEPGIYVPSVAGIRIEDDVLVTATGAKKLSTLSRELRDAVLK